MLEKTYAMNISLGLDGGRQVKQGAGKMRALVYDTYGTPDVLRMDEVENPPTFGS
jgi:hypothetical protein